MIEKTRMITPHFVCSHGLDFKFTAETIMIALAIRPHMPRPQSEAKEGPERNKFIGQTTYPGSGSYEYKASDYAYYSSDQRHQVSCSRLVLNPHISHEHAPNLYFRYTYIKTLPSLA
jgi:hypothetical protein